MIFFRMQLKNFLIFFRNRLIKFVPYFQYWIGEIRNFLQQAIYEICNFFFNDKFRHIFPWLNKEIHYYYLFYVNDERNLWYLSTTKAKKQLFFNDRLTKSSIFINDLLTVFSIIFHNWLTKFAIFSMFNGQKSGFISTTDWQFSTTDWQISRQFSTTDIKLAIFLTTWQNLRFFLLRVIDKIKIFIRD